MFGTCICYRPFAAIPYPSLICVLLQSFAAVFPNKFNFLYYLFGDCNYYYYFYGIKLKIKKNMDVSKFKQGDAVEVSFSGSANDNFKEALTPDRIYLGVVESSGNDAILCIIRDNRGKKSLILIANDQSTYECSFLTKGSRWKVVNFIPRENEI